MRIKIAAAVAVALVMALSACGIDTGTISGPTTTTVGKIAPKVGAASSTAGMLCGDKGSLNWQSDVGWWFENGPIHPYAPGEYTAPQDMQDLCAQATEAKTITTAKPCAVRQSVRAVVVHCD